MLSAVSETDLLEALSAGVLPMLEAVAVPAYIVDCHRRIRWQNAVSIELVGDLRGRLDSSVLAPEDLARAREAFAQKLEGASHTELEVSVARPDGARVRVALSSVPVKNEEGAVIGSLGFAQPRQEIQPPCAEPAPRLSPRERETLRLLAAGYSTVQKAEKMSIANETVRNHVKRVLRRLGARSRVEAIATARRLGLI